MTRESPSAAAEETTARTRASQTRRWPCIWSKHLAFPICRCPENEVSYRRANASFLPAFGPAWVTAGLRPALPPDWGLPSVDGLPTAVGLPLVAGFALPYLP